MLVVCECKPSGAKAPEWQRDHWAERDLAEEAYFGGHEVFRPPVIPVVHGEANSEAVYEPVSDFVYGGGALAVVFGASILRPRALALLHPDHFWNLHLGIAPRYRGSGTNFWPFVNDELKYVGATIMQISERVDAGPIIGWAHPEWAQGDTAHTIGCKAIVSAAEMLCEFIRRVALGETLPTLGQSANIYTYRKRDFTPDVLAAYHSNIKDEIVRRFVAAQKAEAK